MKKSKAAKKQKTNYKDGIKHLINSVQAKMAGHGVFILFLLAGTAIGLSLLRSRAYLNPTRDENHYQEVISSTSYSTIDLNLVTKLKDALSDTDVTVSQSLAPNRSNPFSE